MPDENMETAVLPCVGAVKQGERVIVEVDTSGTPTVIGTVGSGDRTEAAVQEASAVASEAQSLAESVSAHFWHDEQGAHVTSFEQEDSATANGYEALTSASESAAGLLIQRVVAGVRKLLASFTQSGVGLYDGNGKSLASYTAGGFRVGADDAMNVNATASAIQLRTGTKTGVSLTASSLDFYDVSEEGHSYNSASFSKDSSRIGRVGNTGDRKSNVYVGVVNPTAATPENIIAMRTGTRNNAEFHDDHISFYDTAGVETAQFAVNSMRIGKTAAGKNNVLINDTAAYFRSGTTNIAQFNADGITFWQGGGNIATYAYDSWRVGRTGTSSAPRPNLYAGLVDPSDASSEVVMQFRRYNKVRAQLDAEKMAFYDQNGNETAVFASDRARIGIESAGNPYAILNTSGLDINDGDSSVASFGNISRIGKGYKVHAMIIGDLDDTESGLFGLCKPSEAYPSFRIEYQHVTLPSPLSSFWRATMFCEHDLGVSSAEDLYLNASGDINITASGVLRLNGSQINQLIIVQGVQAASTTSINANSMSANITFSVAKDGYTPLGIVGVLPGNNQVANVIVATAYINSSGAAQIRIYNPTSTARTVQPTANVLYVKN